VSLTIYITISWHVNLESLKSSFTSVLYSLKAKTPSAETRGAFGMQSTIKYFEVAKKDIAYLKFVLEGYSGLAVLKTLDPEKGEVVLYIAPGAEEEVADIMASLAREIKSLKPIEKQG
jgi:hypothetical protein